MREAHCWWIMHSKNLAHDCEKKLVTEKLISCWFAFVHSVFFVSRHLMSFRWNFIRFLWQSSKDARANTSCRKGCVGQVHFPQDSQLWWLLRQLPQPDRFSSVLLHLIKMQAPRGKNAIYIYKKNKSDDEILTVCEWCGARYEFN